jgi:ABC-type bacteriocin/lantibiotic exporter with double-glycine peptidase domain
LILAATLLASPGSSSGATPKLAVPIVEQAPERCGQAALEMVLGFYGAGPAGRVEAERAYDPVLRGSLITDLAAAARRAGYQAEVGTLTPDSLIALLGQGVPPIVLYQNGRGPLTVPHYAVVTGWDPTRKSFTLNDGGAKSRITRQNDLAKRWRTAGSQALIVRRQAP